MTLFAEHSLFDINEKCCLEDSDVYETSCDTRGELYRTMQTEYGRCVGKVYIGDGQAIGWIFRKRERYQDCQDCNETFLQEAWVSVHDRPPTKTIEYHYADQ